MTIAADGTVEYDLSIEELAALKNQDQGPAVKLKLANVDRTENNAKNTDTEHSNDLSDLYDDEFYDLYEYYGSMLFNDPFDSPQSSKFWQEFEDFQDKNSRNDEEINDRVFNAREDVDVETYQPENVTTLRERFKNCT